MPKATRWFLRSSFVCLLTGMGIGALLLFHKAYPLHPALWTLLPVHIELLIFGWIIQFTMGTAYWILPRFLQGSARGNTEVARLTFGLFNIGVAMVIMDALLPARWPLALAGRGCEIAAVFLFIRLHWGRVVSHNQRR